MQLSFEQLGNHRVYLAYLLEVFIICPSLMQSRKTAYPHAIVFYHIAIILILI